MKQTYVALVENSPGVLNRVVNNFRRRSINVESLSVAPCEKKGVSRITLVANNINEDRKNLFVHVLNNLVNVIEANVVSGDSHITREIMIIKIDINEKNKINQILNENIRIVKSKSSKILIEIIGSSEELDNFLEKNSNLKVLEIVRSGKVAL
tara:strand:+ start:11651 stop:12109 length:459 start_codon:yes stop_codon:yes gene_type:complete